jgi:hypothetical protein
MSDVEAQPELYSASGSWSTTLAATPLLTVPTASPSACRSCGGEQVGAGADQLLLLLLLRGRGAGGGRVDGRVEAGWGRRQ